ncbi:MAG: N-acetylmuramoyl-L-alanine amidase [Deltaproteobacteria bacterium]|nr:N-acetylmuramoyl-L-alanine amidase [Deltaproteobacteria bacterium]
MPRAGKLFLILAVWIFGSGWVATAWAQNQILNIRHWVAPDHTRVVIDMTEDAPFKVEKGEQKLAIDIEATSLPSQLPAAIVLKKPGVDQILLSSPTPAGVRVELLLPGPVQSTVFKLKKFEDKPYRIVVDLVLPDAEKKESEARERVKVTRKARIVVIDPGHGGDAPGAVGKKGTFEKDVVLAIAKKLRDQLNSKEGYRAFLTRSGDYYVSFKKRVTIAREYGADLFVSIHADAARNRDAHGTSVYCLSTGGASSEAAKILARSENLADVVGGVPNGEGSDVSDPIILDMFQTHNINQSRNFGGLLLGELSAANGLKFASVQEAPFRVLKLPEVPSILVETAYISNPNEEKLLRSDRFQMQLAQGMARSIVQFLPPLPPAAVTVTAGKGEGSKPKGAAGQGKGPAKRMAAVKGAPAPEVSAGKEETEAKQQDTTAGEGEGPLKPKIAAQSPPAPTVAAGGEEAESKPQDATAAEGKVPAKRKIAQKRSPNPVAAAGKEETETKPKDAAAGEEKEPAKPRLTGKGAPAPAVSAGKEEGGGKPQEASSGQEKGPAKRKVAAKGAPAPVVSAGKQAKEPKPQEALAGQGKGPAKRKVAAKGVPAPPAAKPERFYRVKKGDTLAEIAAKHGTTTQVLMELNRLKRPNLLYVDRKLILPGG